MAQAGYTPIQLYYSTTTTNAPTSGNLASGELAINITDGKLFYKDNGGSVQVIAWKTTPTTAGGTGLTSWTAGDLPYYSTGTTLTKLGIGTNGQILTSTGTAPQWSTLSGVAVTTFSAGTTGFTPSVATSGAVTLAGTLATTNGGTGLTSFTANGVVYASSSSALTTGSALTFNGTNTFTVIPSTGTAYSRTESTQFSTWIQAGAGNANVFWEYSAGTPVRWVDTSAGEQMRLTSTGLGIGTSSPGAKLSVVNAISAGSIGTSFQQEIVNNNGAGVGDWSGTIYRWLPNNANTNQAYIGAIITSNSGDTLSDLVFGVKNSTTGNTIVEAMRISKGNLGLGVTPSAWGSNFRNAIQGPYGNYALYADQSNYARFGLASNAFHNGTSFTYVNTSPASQYQQFDGVHRWFNAPSGTAGNAISFTQAMTLDASGNFYVGTTSQSGGSNITFNQPANADMKIAASVSTGTRAAYQVFISNTVTTVGTENSTGGSLASGTAAYATVLANNSAYPICFATNNTERARIDSSGNLSVGGSAARGTTAGAAAIQLFNGTAPAGTLTNGVSLYSSSGDLRFMDAAGNAYQVGFRNIPQSGSAKTTSYTLATTDVGEYIQVGSSGSVTIPDATFATGDVVSVFNNTSGTITITCSITTAYIAGTDSDKATMTLASRGVATILFISSTVCVVSGNVT